MQRLCGLCVVPDKELGAFHQKIYQPACLFTRLLRPLFPHIKPLGTKKAALNMKLNTDENPAHSGIFFFRNRLSNSQFFQTMVFFLSQKCHWLFRFLCHLNRKSQIQQ